MNFFLSRKLRKWREGKLEQEEIVRCGTAVVPAVLDALNDPSPRLRKNAAEGLGLIGDRNTVPALIEAVKDREWYVVIAAAKALGQIKDSRATKPLLEVLRSSSDSTIVRMAAAERCYVSAIQSPIVSLETSFLIALA